MSLVNGACDIRAVRLRRPDEVAGTLGW
jgi:hypothetical protein